MAVRGRGQTASAGVAIAAIIAFGACKAKGGRTEYSNSPDSGAAAPATQLDSSMRSGMPDSTSGGPNRTGTRGVAGDTLSTRGRPVGTGVVRPDSTKRKRP